MSIKIENYICILLMIPAFLLGGFIHVAFYGLDFFDGICQIYYSSLAIMWGVTIFNRVTDRRIYKMLVATVGLMIFVFMLQMCRYKLLGDDLNSIRYAWYGYYVLILGMICLLFQTAVCAGTRKLDDIKNKWNILVCGVTGLIAMLVMTNDIHQIVFGFPDGVKNGYHTYNYGVGFYLIYVWIFMLYIASLVVIIKKCRVFAVRKLAWLPIVFPIIGCVCEILIMFGIIKFNGINIWQTGEAFLFGVVGFEESCIAIGLIPANVGYRKLIDLTNKLIIISDSEGEVVCQSEAAPEFIDGGDEILMFTDKISGGTVSWAVDMSKIFKLNHQIEEATEQIEIRNEYLHTQNDLKSEQSKINARNELYDNMAHILRPQIDKIKELLRKQDEPEFDRHLCDISVLNAYIKRRSNMELLCSDKEYLSLKELGLAIKESCEYINLCGAQTMVSPVPDKLFKAESIICAYEYFEEIVESTLESLKSIVVVVTSEENLLTMRLRVEADTFELDLSGKKDIGKNNGTIKVIKEDGDTVFTLMLDAGGKV